MEYIIMAILTVIVVLLAVILVLNLKKSKTSKSFTTEELDILATQADDIIKSVREYMLGESNSIQNGVTRQIGLMNEVHSKSGENLNKSMETFTNNQQVSFVSLEKKLNDQIVAMRDEVRIVLENMRIDNSRQNNEIREVLDRKLDGLQTKVNDNLEKIRVENEAQLTQMRMTVDEKLQETLNTRISDSFKVINEQLLAVHKGLGEMAVLSNGVNNLNKVLSNVKTRGIWGEVALDNMLEQILLADQYGTQIPVDGKEVVDFAIYLPGDKKDRVLLPIDAKFPLCDYEKLVEASETCDKEQVASAKKALIARIKLEAKSISAKYIKPPKTTNFAVMYLPIEGLFSEVAKEIGLMDELQSKYRIVVSGPTTLSALLNSLQIGFKTLAIQQKSADVWKALSKFKTEFVRFSESLEDTKKKASDVVKRIETNCKNTERIGKVLDSLDVIDYGDEEVELIGDLGE